VRLTNSTLAAASQDEIKHIYMKEQCHENIFEFAHHVLIKNKPRDSLHLQVCQYVFTYLADLLYVAIISRIMLFIS